MWSDPIIEEVRRVKREIAAEFNYDIHALCEHLRQRERESGRAYVTLPPRHIERAEAPPVPPIEMDSPLDTGPTVES